MSTPPAAPRPSSPASGNVLDLLERAGNALPSPATLFVVGTALVAVVSELAVRAGWSVPAADPAAAPVVARSLLSSEGLWWLLSHLVDNFVNFPPLGIVLVGMLGVGLAEQAGLLPALLGRAMRATPAGLLAPATVLLGVMSSMALDAGYVLLPPLAGALFLAAGRSPLAGIALAFAGTSAGFSANLLITPLDALLAGFTEAGARVLEPDYAVAVTCNWYFMAASTLLVTLVGWGVNRWVVESRLSRVALDPDAEAGPPPASAESEQRGLRAALLTLGVLAGLVALAVAVPGAPLHGQGERHARWVEASVPLLFLLTFLPGLAYGRAAGTLREDREVAAALGRTLAGLGPYLVLAFFAAQFIESFKYTRLGEMLAVGGGLWLVEARIAPALLLLGFLLGAMLLNLLIASASAKYAVLAPVFVPMFMGAGIGPELTQATFRIADSVTNVVTPLNPYLVVVLAAMQRHVRTLGVGTLIAAMLPYTLALALAWAALLLLWVALGLPLGPGIVSTPGPP